MWYRCLRLSSFETLLQMIGKSHNLKGQKPSLANASKTRMPLPIKRPPQKVIAWMYRHGMPFPMCLTLEFIPRSNRRVNTQPSWKSDLESTIHAVVHSVPSNAIDSCRATLESHAMNISALVDVNRFKWWTVIKESILFNGGDGIHSLNDCERRAATECSVFKN